MFKSIGLVIAMIAISHLMDNAFIAFESALVATFNTIEIAAELSQMQLQKSH